MGNALARRDGGGYTPSLPASLASAPPAELATFGAGCYWGTEKHFKAFAAKHPGAIADMRVGFMGGPEAAPNPSYEAVCTGRTGHVEALQLRFDPAAVPYDALVAHFFTFHDPTTPNRQARERIASALVWVFAAPASTHAVATHNQGNDRGTQYASAIFTHTEEQRAVAAKRIGSLQSLLESGSLSGAGFGARTVATAVRPAGAFYPAEEAHQRYLERNPGGYCNHMKARGAAAPRSCVERKHVDCTAHVWLRLQRA
jgi:peptide-methionine (S)-S-oxide reductase